MKKWLWLFRQHLIYFWYRLTNTCMCGGERGELIAENTFRNCKNFGGRDLTFVVPVGKNCINAFAQVADEIEVEY